MRRLCELFTWKTLIGPESGYRKQERGQEGFFFLGCGFVKETVPDTPRVLENDSFRVGYEMHSI